MTRVIFWVTLVVAIAGLLTWIAFEAEQAEERLHRLNAQIEEQHEAIRVLEAEWAYLTSPDRIRRLSERHLPLRPMRSEQFAWSGQIPRAVPDMLMTGAPLPGRKPQPGGGRRLAEGLPIVAATPAAASSASTMAAEEVSATTASEETDSAEPAPVEPASVETGPGTGNVAMTAPTPRRRPTPPARAGDAVAQAEVAQPDATKPDAAPPAPARRRQDDMGGLIQRVLYQGDAR